jgi:serine/threonine-protein kinase
MVDDERVFSGSNANAGYPHQMGPYLLLTALGRGGMGMVHLAKVGGVAGIEKYCVVKTLRKKHTENEEYVSRFMDEARVVVNLSHRNICSVFDVGRVHDRFYMAMEFIEGRDLSTLMTRMWEGREPFPIAVALHIVMEVLDALDYAHRRKNPATGEALNVVHRDVSPHNVMITFEGEVKLIDFGLAASTLKEEQTDPKIVMGKLAYMSREHLNSEPVDGRHDLFGAAVMLYELIAGEPYYTPLKQHEILEVLSEGVHTPRRLKEFDPELRGILARALHPDNDKRTRSCGEFRDEILDYAMQRSLGVGSRLLRKLVDKHFPGEAQNTEHLLGEFRNAHPPAKVDETQTFARRSASGAGLPGTSSDAIPSPPGTGPSTNPTSRIVRDDDVIPADATQVLPRVHVAEQKSRRGRGLAAALGVFLALALGGGMWFVASGDEGTPPDAELAALPAEAPLEEPPAPPAETAPADKAPAETAPAAGDDAAAKPSDEVAAAAGSGDEPAATEPTTEPDKPRARRGRRTPRKKPPALAAGASPMQKIQYLKRHCRHQKCGRTLVKRFETVGLAGMSTAEVRAFWPKVKRCVDRCSK